MSFFPMAGRGQAQDDCLMSSTTIAANYNSIVFEFGIILVLSKILHAIFRYIYQPRIFSDLALGIVLSELHLFSVSNEINMVFGKVGSFIFSPYLFALGVEMDPSTLLGPPGSDAIVAYAGMLSTCAVIALFHWPLMDSRYGILHEKSLRACLGLTVALANTTSPVLTRLATDLKIAKTTVGHLAVGAGISSDMVTTLLMAIGTMIWHDIAAEDAEDSSRSVLSRVKHPFFMAAILAEIVIVGLVSRPVIDWINDRNPEGQRMRGTHLSMVAVAAAVLCWLTTAMHLDINMAAFLVGLAFPSEGRLSRLLVSKINIVLNSIILPLYVFHVCSSLRQTTDEVEDPPGLKNNGQFHTAIMRLPFPWWKILFVTAIGTFGKLIGTAAAGLAKGLGWLEALALGMLLNVKGYFHIYCALCALELGIITDRSFMAIIFMVALNVAVTPMVGLGIASWARRSVQWRLMGLQHHNPSTELRLVAGLHGPQDVPTLTYLMEALRWGGGNGELALYAVDMVQLTDQTAAAIVKGHGYDGVTVVDEDVTDMRKQIGQALHLYQSECGEGVKVRRLLALSSFPDMHCDICICAEDAMAVLILLPFHRSQRPDGSMDAGHFGFRVVNQKVLHVSPCSVGIMVDRGLGKGSRSSVSEALQNVVVVFIGGADDREALTLASFMLQQPSLKLTALRFVQKASTQARPKARTGLFESTSKCNNLPFAQAQDTILMHADDEFFAEFYQRHISSKKGIGYIEKHVADGAELVSVLRDLQVEYQLFVVGCGRERNSVLTDGLAQWAECPELGPVGDILASSDFSHTASVLVVQQYDAKKHYKVIDDEFMPL